MNKIRLSQIQISCARCGAPAIQLFKHELSSEWHGVCGAPDCEGYFEYQYRGNYNVAEIPGLFYQEDEDILYQE